MADKTWTLLNHSFDLLLMSTFRSAKSLHVPDMLLLGVHCILTGHVIVLHFRLDESDNG